MSTIALIPNRIIITRFTNGKDKLTKLALSYVMAIFSYIKPGDIADEGKDYKTVRIPKADLKNKFGLKTSGYYRDLKKACEEIASFVFNVAENPMKDLVTENIKIINMHNHMFIDIQISRKLLQMLDIENGTEGFTQIHVNRFLAFKSEYSKKLFIEMSDRRWELESTKDYTEEQIRELLGLEDKYDRFNDVLYYGLGMAKDEFDKQINADFYFTYEPIKGSVKGKYIGVKIHKRDKSNYISINELNSEKSYNKHIVNLDFDETEKRKKIGYLQVTFGLKDYTARRVFERIHYEAIKIIIEESLAIISKANKNPDKSKHIRSKAAVFVDAIQQKYGKAIFMHEDDYVNHQNEKAKEFENSLNKKAA